MYKFFYVRPFIYFLTEENTYIASYKWNFKNLEFKEKKLVESLFYKCVILDHTHKINWNATNTAKIYKNDRLRDWLEQVILDSYGTHVINYFKKEIEPIAYDYAFKDSEFLDKYWVNNIRVEHLKREIRLVFPKSEIVAACVLAETKLSALNTDESAIVKVWDEKVEFKTTWELIAKALKILKSKPYARISINSSNYDLTREKGIIVYYNTNDEYHNALLDEILDDSPYRKLITFI